LIVGELKGFEGSDVYQDIQERVGEKEVDSEPDGGIMETMEAAASPIFANTDEQLYINAQKITPISGYEDVVVHSDQDCFYVYGRDGTEFAYTPRELSEMIKGSPNYHGGSIRLIACDAGTLEDGAAQKLADELNVNVLAPTTTVWTLPDGTISIETERGKQDGEWKEFKPRSE